MDDLISDFIGQGNNNNANSQEIHNLLVKQTEPSPIENKQVEPNSFLSKDQSVNSYQNSNNDD